MDNYYGVLEADAKAFAELHHNKQQYGDLPYTSHLIRVHDILTTYGYSDEYLIAAWLHDIVEDTDVTIQDIEDKFSRTVANLVWAVTGEGSNRKVRNQSAYRKMQQYPASIILKLADRIANVEMCIDNNPAKFEMYYIEHDTFKAALQPHGDKHMWLYLDYMFYFLHK